MSLLTGLTADGTEVPVQVKPDGKLVAEGLQGPAGPAGPKGDDKWESVNLDLAYTRGRVLVGTSTASSAAGQGTPQIQSAGDYQQSSLLLRNTSNDNTNCALVLQKIRGSSIVQNGDYLGQVAFDGYDGAADRQGATIAAIVDGTTGSGDLPTRLVFSTTRSGQASPVEALIIDSQQRVNIKSPNGSWWAISVSDTGQLSAVAS